MSDAVMPADETSALGRPGRRSRYWADLAIVQESPWLEDHLGRVLLFAPVPPAPGELIVTFGQYIEQPLSALLANTDYVEWLATSHKWNPRRHPEVYEAVLRARREPPPERGLGELLYSAATVQEVRDYLAARVWPRYRGHYKVLVLDMDDDPTKVYLYINRAEPIVYYVQHQETGLVKIGTTREAVQSRAISMKHDQGLPGTWRPLAIERGTYDLERQRHREFSDLRIAVKPDGRRNRELFEPDPRLMGHIHGVLQACHNWVQPSPRTSLDSPGKFLRTVLDAELPEAGGG